MLHRLGEGEGGAGMIKDVPACPGLVKAGMWQVNSETLDRQDNFCTSHIDPRS